MSEVYKWPKNLPGNLNLEKHSKEFESHGFHTLESLKYLWPGHIDAFFPSPEKLLLAEKCTLESEIKVIVDAKSKRPLELSQRFNSFSEINCCAASSYNSQMSPSNLFRLLDILLPTITTTPCKTMESSIAGGQENKPLDRKRNEMKENLLDQCFWQIAEIKS